MHPTRRALSLAALATLLVGPVAAARQPAPPTAAVVSGLPLVGPASSARVGDTVTIAGRATVASGVLQARGVYLAVQGDAGAVWVFRRNSAVAVRRGDSVEARGALFVYRGSIEIIATSLTVVPTAQLATPAPDSGWPAAPLREARLVRVSHAVVGARGESEGGRWIRLHAPGHADSVTLWIPWTHADPPGLADVRTEDVLDVTGLATLYRDNPGDPGVWQIVPRRATDVHTVGIPRLVYRRLVQGTVLLVVVVVLVVVATRLLTRRQSLALRETEARYRQLLALSPDAVLVHDGDRVLFANAAAARLLGAADEQAMAGWSVDTFVGTDERAALDAAVGRRQPAGAPVGRRLRTVFRTTDGAHVDVEVATSPCRYHDRDAAVVVARDIGPQLRYERELRELALLDELTGLHNRRGFFLFAEAELRRLRERGSYAVLVFADLDGLKTINDRHGHAAGDQALRAVARGLRDLVGEQGLAARWSGDEFVALVPDASVAAAPNGATDASGDTLVAEAFEQRLAGAIVRHAPAAAPYPVSASVGARRLGPDAGETLAAALAAADAGLYRRRGRRATANGN
ncbi:GGDEF domain-containing protein [Gemmatirosa kalamazoonensis]|uniref:GGDEF domain-containing protein n=1 Tax=Gemmatirosa kalamazoonensis TaxID=861299 RepID=UPI0004BA3E0C|nr:sensor domain-containing diguanylate cyclase [Gemmatirosa kalamazoonensis]